MTISLQGDWQRIPGGTGRRNGARPTGKCTPRKLTSSFPNADNLRVGKRTLKAAVSTQPTPVKKIAVTEAAKANSMFRKHGVPMKAVGQNENHALCIFLVWEGGSHQERHMIHSQKGIEALRTGEPLNPREGLCSGWEGRLKRKVEGICKRWESHLTACAA